MASLKVVHTSDIHLGKRFPQLPGEGEQLRARDLLRVFSDIVDHSAKIEANLLVIAGDLFDHVNVPHETIAQVLASLGRFNAKCPDSHVILVPGESELLQRNVDSRDSLLHVFTHLPFVHLLGAADAPDTLRLSFPGHNTVVSAAPLDFFLSPNFKTKDVPAAKDGFGIFVLHAHTRRHAFNPDDTEEWRERVLAPLASRGYKYLALGHRHSLHQIPASDILAVFPGSPERLHLETDREKKYFVTLDVTGGVAKMKPVATRVRPVEFLSITCAPGEDKVTPVLRSLTGPASERILYIVLEGQMDDRAFAAVKQGPEIADLRGRYAVVHIDNRLILIDAQAGYDYSALRVEPPAGEFRNFVEREIAAAPAGSEEAILLKELLQAGLAEIEEGP